MIIDCVSDPHGSFPELEGGDLLLIAGDLTSNDTVKAWCNFYEWMYQLKYRKIIYIGGNHDNLMTSFAPTEEIRKMELNEEPNKYEYLFNSGIQFEGLKIWGSPNSKWFHGVNPKCKAFMCNESKLHEIYAKIPIDTNILITHGPPFGMMDKIHEWGNPDKSCFAGSKSLADRLLYLRDLNLHVFGHIHEGYGECYAAYENLDINDPLGPVRGIGHLSINASIMNREYEPINKPIRVIF